MSAKAKAFQAMAIIAISALTYTVYHAAYRQENKSGGAGVNATALVPGKKAVSKPKENLSTPFAAIIPGYCNPEEKNR